MRVRVVRVITVRMSLAPIQACLRRVDLRVKSTVKKRSLFSAGRHQDEDPERGALKPKPRGAVSPNMLP